MTALLALIPTKDKIYAVVIAVLIILGIHIHNKLIAEGIAKQKAADDVAAATLAKKTAKETADLQARATMAEKSFDQEQANNAAFRSSHPGEPVRLCLDSHGSGGGLPQAGGKVAGNVAAGAGTQSVQPVSTGDRSGGQGAAGPDIFPMLDSFAASCDQVSGTLREFQKR